MLVPEDVDKDLEYVTGRLSACPGTGDPPIIHMVSSESHSILPLGHLRDLIAETNYDQDHYCLEMIANGTDYLSSALLVTAFCHPWPTGVITHKCCELDQYFNHAVGNCLPKMANMSNEDSLVYEFYQHNPRVTTFHINTGRLTCDNGKAKLVQAADAYLSDANQLCERRSGRCYSLSHYCIEYMWARGDETMTAVASACPIETFRKCCPGFEILTEAGCVPPPEEHIPSMVLMQLLEIMEPTFGFPTQSGGTQCVRDLVNSAEADIYWTISRSGFLSINTKASTESYETMHYCTDDYKNPENQTDIVAIMCSNELEGLAPVHLSEEESEKRSIGKCCPHGHYLGVEENVCVSDELGLDLMNEPILKAANVSKLTYTFYPQCNSYKDPESTGPTKYFPYILASKFSEDHAVLTDDLNLDIVSMIDKCPISSQPIHRQDYCLEYTVNAQRDAQPTVFTCTKPWIGTNVHGEKYSLYVVLLSMSCMALLATAFSLVSTRVRRGLVTVKKVR